MSSLNTLSIEQIDAQLAELRAMKKQLRQTGKSAERKVNTLRRRRDRLMARVGEIDSQIAALSAQGAPATPAVRRPRGRPRKQQ
jgi:chromosome segregation ATPase